MGSESHCINHLCCLLCVFCRYIRGRSRVFTERQCNFEATIETFHTAAGVGYNATRKPQVSCPQACTRRWRWGTGKGGWVSEGVRVVHIEAVIEAFYTAAGVSYNATSKLSLCRLIDWNMRKSGGLVKVKLQRKLEKGTLLRQCVRNMYLLFQIFWKFDLCQENKLMFRNSFYRKWACV